MSQSDEPAEIIAPVEQGTLTNKQLELVKRTQLGDNASDEDLMLYAYQCQRLGLDPFAKQIYGMMMYDKRKGRYNLVTVVSIDGYRLVAERSGKYRGQKTEWCGPDGNWKDVWLEEDHPAAARVTVFCKGMEPTSAIALWKSYYKDNDFWNNFGELMLEKCAEGLALRKVCPNELSGTYSDAEMQQAITGDDADTPTQQLSNSQRRTRARPSKRLPAKSSGRNGSSSKRPAKQPAKQPSNQRAPTKEQKQQLHHLAQKRGVDLEGYVPPTVEAWELDMERLQTVETPAADEPPPPDDADQPAEAASSTELF